MQQPAAIAWFVYFTTLVPPLTICRMSDDEQISRRCPARPTIVVMKSPRKTHFRAHWVLLAWLCWSLFVVYGSLVPLDFQPVSWSVALGRFSDARLLDVGVAGRADWVANGVLYLPFGALGALALAGRSTAGVAALAAFLLGVGLALVVEFAQVFFPPRTVSLNDLLAEGAGTVIGALLARGWIQGRAHAFAARQFWLSGPILPLGVGLLFVASLFPFDLLIAPAEWSAKWHGRFWGGWRAPLFASEGLSMTLARFLAEALVVLPLGAWWARMRLRGGGLPSLSGLVLQGAAWGAFLGLGLEFAQWWVASGVSQGVSVLSRAAGWGCGAMLGVLSAAWTQEAWRALLRRLTLPLVAALLASAVAKAGWWGGAWLSAQEAMQRISGGEVRFLPLYYHYYTSEGAAVQSVVPVLMLFAPLGFLCWAWMRSPWWAALVAALLSAAMEFGRLWSADLRPDPSNVWIAAVAAYAAAWGLLRWVPAMDVVPATAGAPRAWQPFPGRLGLLAFVAVGLVAWLLRFPVYTFGLGVMLMAAAALVWWRPVLLLSVAVAALPLLNLTIWSGREYVDEFDALLLVCIAVAWVRLPVGGTRGQRDPRMGAVVLLIGCSLFVGVLNGWSPWDLAALRHPDSPLSPWYSLRLFKGALWAGLLAWVVRRQMLNGEPVDQAWSMGLVVGLAGVLAVVAWERIVFVGPWNLSSIYRVAGPVLPMRLGGAYLDAFLVVSLPFALLGVLYGRNVVWRAFCGLTTLGTAYAMAVTYTRSTYLAVAVVLFVVAVGMLRPGTRQSIGRVGLGAALLALVAATAYPIVTGPFASARMAQVEKDLETRFRHARDVIAIRSSDAMTKVLGQGLGTFAAQNYWARQLSAELGGAMAAHSVVTDDGVSQLQLGGGPFLFLDQPFSPPPGETLQVQLRARAAGVKAGISVFICHKWILASGECSRAGFALRDQVGEWQLLSGSIKTGTIGADTDVFRKPIRLSIYNGGQQRVDVDFLSVRDSQGRELVRNGSFDEGSDFWSYTSDDHLAWHVKNMVLAIWFDLGWLGLLGFGGLWGLAVWRSGRAAWRGERYAQGMLAALSGLWVVALFDSVVDEPRFLLLLLLMNWMAMVVPGKGRVAFANHNPKRLNQGAS